MTSEPFQLRVEFFGIPRARAGVADAIVELPTHATELQSVLQTLGERFPRLGAECLAGGSLREGFSANINGQRFVYRPEERLIAGETLLLLSADAGG
jgi:molybdopterin converting factor small subunit